MNTLATTSDPLDKCSAKLRDWLQPAADEDKLPEEAVFSLKGYRLPRAGAPAGYSRIMPMYIMHIQDNAALEKKARGEMAALGATVKSYTEGKLAIEGSAGQVRQALQSETFATARLASEPYVDRSTASAGNAGRG